MLAALPTLARSTSPTLLRLNAPQEAKEENRPTGTDPHGCLISGSPISPTSTSEQTQQALEWGHTPFCGSATIAQNLGAWSLDIDAVASETAQRPLMCVGVSIFQQHASELLEPFGLTVDRMGRLLSAVEASYQPNPYHNSRHAADVMHGTYALLLQGRNGRRARGGAREGGSRAIEPQITSGCVGHVNSDVSLRAV